MINQKLVVGIGGLARAGKDTLCNLLIQALYLNNISAKRRALADELKIEIRPKLLDTYGIDVLNCTPEEKEKIRPELVAFGKERRMTSRGTYWTQIVQEKMQDDDEQVIIVPDIRYNFFVEDEVNWVQGKNAGILIHVARYEVNDKGQKVWMEPPNTDERINDPKVRVAADFSLSWSSKPIAELQQDYNGFLQTVSRLAEHELQNIKRRAANL